MIKVDLITGFLGSGKTTFIKKYARHFIDKGEKVGILENDYGAVNVDMLLLNELRGDNCELEMVAGACDSDCHKRRFKTKLIAMGMSSYDRVIIEPSGVFDMDEFFDTLHDDPLDRWYQIGSVITIVDACLEDDLSEEADFFLASQVANAGTILLSKTDMASENDIKNTISHIKKACENTGLKKNIDPIIINKSWDSFDDSDINRIAASGYTGASYIKKMNATDNNFKTLYFLEVPVSAQGMKAIISTLMHDKGYGNIIRIKGFFKENKAWYQVNATRRQTNISSHPAGQEVFIVIGQSLKEDKIKAFIHQHQDPEATQTKK